MLLLDQISLMCEKYASCSLEEERMHVARTICDECVNALRKQCDIDTDFIMLEGLELGMRYYGISTEARAYAKRVEKKEGDEYKASVICFYATILTQKSLVLVDYYGRTEAKKA